MASINPKQVDEEKETIKKEESFLEIKTVIATIK